MSTNTAAMNTMTSAETPITNGGTEPATGAPKGDSIGRHLKRAREEKNLSLDEVSRATKIKKDFLSAIEEDRHELLPGPVFARGFVRSYADYLGLDGQSAALKAVRSGTSEIPEPPGALDRASGALSWVVALAGVGAVVAAIAYVVSTSAP